MPISKPDQKVGDHCVWLTTGTGHGTTNPKIRRFVNTVKNVGTAVTYADSVTLGATFTINETGLYSVSYQDGGTTSVSMRYGVSINSAELQTKVETILAATRFGFGAATGFSGTSNATGTIISGVLRLSAGDVLRAHTDGASPSLSDLVFFNIRKVGI